MVRGEENGGRLVYMYEPRSTFVSISCCHIHVCNSLLLICIIIGTIPSLQGVLIVPLAMGLLTLFMMFYGKTICVCLDHMSDCQLPLTWYLFWSVVYWECFSPSEGNTSCSLTVEKNPLRFTQMEMGKNCCKHLMLRIEKAHLNGYYIEILKFKNHLDVLFIELKKVN